MAWKIEEETVNVKEIKVGDRVQFRAVTRWSSRTVWRKVTGVNPCIQVRYGGWSHFHVRNWEIKDHEPSGTGIACEPRKINLDKGERIRVDS